MDGTMEEEMEEDIGIIEEMGEAEIGSSNQPECTFSGLPCLSLSLSRADCADPEERNSAISYRKTRPVASELTT